MSEMPIKALEHWAERLGAEHVVVDERTLSRAETATFQTTQRVTAVIRPGNKDEVQDCVRIANQFNTPIYPISTGKNWGYGSSVPPQSGCTIMDLSRLNSIVNFNEKLAYVTIEPGVTQRQLYDFLVEKGGTLWMDATGSSPDCSIIGNTLERGFGHTPYGDHFAHACGMEVILPSGECIYTGFGSPETAPATPVYKWGVGPYLDGLFTQSNLGIVTQMTIWLMPKPEHFLAFNFSIGKDSELEVLLEGLRQLRLEGTIRSAVHIGDAYKVFSSIQQYPWEGMQGQIPLSAELLEQYKKKWRFGAWNGSGGLYGTKGQVAAARARIKKVLKPRTSQLKFINDHTLQIGKYAARPYKKLTGTDLAELLKLVRPAYGLLKGEPTAFFLASTYWRKRGTIPEEMNPDMDGCGLIWCAPVTPNDAKCVRRLLDIVRGVFCGHPFEPAMSLTMINERSLENVISISYDRAIPGEDERAKLVHRDLLKRLEDAGYHPYRHTIADMPGSPAVSPERRRLLSRIKQAIDPVGILAPQRYNPNLLDRN